MPCRNATLRCGNRSCAPLNSRSSPMYCYQLSPAVCERHAVMVSRVLYACNVSVDSVLGPRCKLGEQCRDYVLNEARRQKRRKIHGQLGGPSEGARLRHSNVHADDCARLAQLPAVFIVALGRTGSSQLVRLLNAIPGFRVSGESDNAWAYLARHARSTRSALVGIDRMPLLFADKVPVCETWPPWGERASARASVLRERCERKHISQRGRSIICRRARQAANDAQRCHEAATARECMSNKQVALDCPLACGSCHPDGQFLTYEHNGELCSARRLVLAVLNPDPRTRVFGFKEIFSPWIRRPQMIGEIFESIGFLRSLFPRAKVLFHWRENLTRVASSDFWRLEKARAESVSRFEQIVAAYQDYIRRHRDHAFGTTLEDIMGYRAAAKQVAWCEQYRHLKMPSGKPMYRCLQPSFEHLDETFGHNGENMTWQMLFYLKCCAPEQRPRTWSRVLPWCQRARDARTAAGIRPAIICRQPGENVSKLEQLFAFLQENVSNASTFKAAEVELLPLKDWSEEVHTRRIAMRLPNGTVMHQLQSFAWETSSQNQNPHLQRHHPAAVRPVRRSLALAFVCAVCALVFVLWLRYVQ